MKLYLKDKMHVALSEILSIETSYQKLHFKVGNNIPVLQLRKEHSQNL
jgi:hypothetical protein